MLDDVAYALLRKAAFKGTLVDVSVTQAGLFVFRLAAAPGDSLAFDLVVDTPARVCFLIAPSRAPGSGGSLGLFVEALQEQLLMAGEPPGAPLPLPSLLRALGTAAASVPPLTLPPAPAFGPSLARAAGEGLAALCFLPELLVVTESSSRASLGLRLARVLAGAVAGLGLASNACFSTRYADVCDPMPHFRLVGEGRDSKDEEGLAASSTAEEGAAEDSTTRSRRRFADALARLPPDLLHRLLQAVAATTDKTVADDSTAPSLPALLAAALACPSLQPAVPLLYWVAVLAPSRLVLLPGRSLAPPPRGIKEEQQRVLSYAVVQGPWSAAAAAAVAQETECMSRLGASQLRQLASQAAALACNPSSAADEWGRPAETSQATSLTPRWAADALAAHGLLTNDTGRKPNDAASGGYYHGTASDNAHCLLQKGVQVLSGTRRERSGSMYGAGVYLSNAWPVAVSFAKATGSVAPQLQLFGPPSSSSQPPPFVPCLWAPVFEFSVIAAPEVEVWREGKRLPRAVGSVSAPPGSYVVVPSPRLLHTARLHLVFTAPERHTERSESCATQQSTNVSNGSKDTAAPSNFTCLHLLSLFAVLAGLLAAAASTEGR